MVAIGRFRRVAREWVAAALGVAALAVAAVVYFHEAKPSKTRLTITAGSPDGLRHQFAEHLARVVARRGVVLKIVGTSGSEEAIEKVNAGVLDLALVQGGLDPTGRGHVRQVASMKIEPLHLLVKAEIEPDAGEGRGLNFLRGRTVNLSEIGSGTYNLAREVLSFAGLQPNGEVAAGDYSATIMGYRALVAEPDRARLPDAVFTVSALPSPVVKHLVTHRNFRIVPLRFGEAFALDALHHDLPDAHGRLGAHGVDRLHVYHTEIPAYTYSVAPPIPPQPVSTFGTRLLLVAHENTSAASIARLLEAAFANGPGGPPLDPAQLDIAPELDWHDGTLAYRERTKPLFIGDAVDFLEKGTSLLGAILGATFFLWQWYCQRVSRRRDQGFESYILKVTAIERRALDLELGAMLDLKELLRLQVELGRLKSEALQRFADGDLEGEELISGFVTHANDARDYLTRLILHERDNVEQEAARQLRSSESLWCETVGDLDRSPVAGDGGEKREESLTG